MIVTCPGGVPNVRPTVGRPGGALLLCPFGHVLTDVEVWAGSAAEASVGLREARPCGGALDLSARPAPVRPGDHVNCLGCSLPVELDGDLECWRCGSYNGPGPDERTPLRMPDEPETGR